MSHRKEEEVIDAILADERSQKVKLTLLKNKGNSMENFRRK